MNRRTGVLLAAIAAAVYAPALATGFNADDFLILWRIKSIGAAGDPLGYFRFAFYEYFRPLAFLSYALDWNVWGLSPFGFHLTNVLLHAANTLLVFQLASRLLPARGAALAAGFFALHPAAHEVVYWVAARFDLLATFFVLAALAFLSSSRRGARAAGLVAFALALLSKESAISLLVIAPAWDVLIEGRTSRETVRRLVPLLAVTLAYAAARSLGADLDAVGGERRLPKLVMTSAAIAAVLWLAHGRDKSYAALTSPRLPFVVIAAIVLVSVIYPAWAAEKLGFVAHVMFYSLTPVVFPSPSQVWFVAPPFLPVLAATIVCVAATWYWFRGVASSRRNTVLFVAVMIAATLLPVSSMTGGLRYLYLPSVGVALLLAHLVESLAPARRKLALAVVAVMLLVSTQQLLEAGRRWRHASTMTYEGVLLMAGSVNRCGQDDVLLLTAPVGIGGVYANLSWDAFDVLANCTPRSFMTLLRLTEVDVTVAVSRPDPATIELRIPDYRGTAVASRDLRNFGLRIAPGDVLELDTPAGHLQTFAEDSTQVFRLAMADVALRANRFYYSDGRIRR